MTLGTLAHDLHPALCDHIVALVIYAWIAWEDGDDPAPWAVWGEA